jgi:hypothetical protein
VLRRPIETAPFIRLEEWKEFGYAFGMGNSLSHLVGN